MYFVCSLLFCHILVTARTATNPRSVNVNLETVLHFNPNENSGDVQFIDGIQQFLGKVKNIIRRRTGRRYRGSPRKHDTETFTDFVKNVINILQTFSNDDLEDAIAVVTDEARKYHYEGCKFHELLENNDLRRYVTDELSTAQNKTGEDIKKSFDKVLKSLENVKFNNEQVELMNYVNSLYGNKDTDKMKSFLNDIKAYKSNTKRVNLDLVRILRNGLRNIIFDHYSSLNAPARKELKIRVEGYFYRDNEEKTGITKKIKQKEMKNTLFAKRYNILKNFGLELVTPENAKKILPSYVGHAAEKPPVASVDLLTAIKNAKRGKRKEKKEKKNKKKKHKHDIANDEELFSEITSENTDKPKKHTFRQHKKDNQTHDINSEETTTDASPAKKHKSKHHRSKNETVENQKILQKHKHNSKKYEEKHTTKYKTQNKKEHKREHKKKHKKYSEEAPLFRQHDDELTHIFDYAAEINVRAQSDRSDSSEVWKPEVSNSKRSTTTSKIPKIQRRNYKKDNTPKSEEGLSIDFTPVPILLSLKTEMTKLAQVLPTNKDKVKNNTINNNKKGKKSNVFTAVNSSNEEIIPKITTVKALETKSITTEPFTDGSDEHWINPPNFRVNDDVSTENATLKSAADVKENNTITKSTLEYIPKSVKITTSVIQTDRHNLKQKAEANNIKNESSHSLLDAKVTVQELKSSDFTDVSNITTLPLRYFTETVKDELKYSESTTAKTANRQANAKDLQNEVNSSLLNFVDGNQNSTEVFDWNKDFHYDEKGFENVTRVTVDGKNEKVTERDNDIFHKDNSLINNVKPVPDKNVTNIKHEDRGLDENDKILDKEEMGFWDGNE